VTATLSDLSISTKALIDTGSPRTILPRGVGDLLGIEFPRYRTEATKKIRLLGQDWAAITETVTLELPPFDDDLTWEAEVDFIVDEYLPFALLGYEGFLNRWSVTFNAAFGYFVVEPADHHREHLDPAVIMELERRHPGLM
jgi:hypothetical protein